MTAKTVKDIKGKPMTSKEERYLRSRVGKQNPFRVPEGYFDGFAARMTENLPEQNGKATAPVSPRRPRVVRMVLYAAACLCIAVLGSAVYWSKLSLQSAESGNAQMAVHTVTNTDVYVDAVADYTMMDNSDIYAYLSEE